MNIFRKRFAVKIFSLLTGIIFLNMSFFLAEVSMLDFKDRQILENVCSLLLNAGLEEERDGHSGGNDAPLKTFSMACEHLRLHHASLFLIAFKMYLEAQETYLHANYSQIFSPPPDLLQAA